MHYVFFIIIYLCLFEEYLSKCVDDEGKKYYVPLKTRKKVNIPLFGNTFYSDLMHDVA